MAKFFGKVGYCETVETSPGVWTEQISEREYFGDVIRNHKRIQNSEHLNDNLDVTNQISIVADPFAYSHFHAMRYVDWMGAKWKITDVEVEYPRLLLSMGGVYNGPEPED